MDITQVPAGYKLTDLGVLPENWEVTKLGKHVAFKTGPFGSALHKSDYVFGGIPIVNPMQIVAGELVSTESMAISKQAALQLSDFLLSSGDIVIGRRGEMGRCAVVESENHGWLCGTGSMIIKVSKSVDARFLQRIISSPAVIAAIESTAVGTTMVNLNQSVLGNLVIPLPPLAEQQAIAAALGEMDALLAAQRARLAKQRAVKQGLLQGLLSGKQRLPGFVGEWEVKRLGELADITKLAGYEYTKHFNSYKDGGEIIVIRGTNITHNKLDLSDVKTIPRATSKYLKRSQLNVGDMVFAYVGTIGPVYLIEDNDRFHLGPNTAKITAKHELEPNYLFQYFTSQLGTDEMAEHISIGAQPSLSMTKIRLFKILTPSIDEQRAIAAVLSEADAYLAALEAEHAKTQLLKQGMMQNLLTGKLRLV